MSLFEKIYMILGSIASLVTIFPLKRRKAIIIIIRKFADSEKGVKLSNGLVFLTCLGFMILAFLSGLIVLLSQNFSQHGIYASFGLFIAITLCSLFFFKSNYQKIV